MFITFARRVRDLWIYFKAGHSGYLVYTMSLLNFVVLQHRLLISYIPLLSQYLSRLSTFFFLFVFTYIPLAIIIGRFEYQKGEMKRRPMLNPYTQDSLIGNIKLNEGLLKFIDGDEEGAKKEIEEGLAVLQKWRLER
jgi:hypothetical protein